MLTLRMGAAKHVLNGITSIAEMKKIVHTTQVDLDLETTDR